MWDVVLLRALKRQKEKSAPAIASQVMGTPREVQAREDTGHPNKMNRDTRSGRDAGHVRV